MDVNDMPYGAGTSYSYSLIIQSAYVYNSSQALIIKILVFVVNILRESCDLRISASGKVTIFSYLFYSAIVASKKEKKQIKFSTFVRYDANFLHRTLLCQQQRHHALQGIQ